MVHFMMVLLFVFNSGVSFAYADWRPIPRHDLLYDTGDCETYFDNEPPMYHATEQCYDGEQLISKATIQQDFRNTIARGVFSKALTIHGTYEYIDIWSGSTFYGRFYGSQLGLNTITVIVPVNLITLQAVDTHNLPAEIYSINEV